MCKIMSLRHVIATAKTSQCQFLLVPQVPTNYSVMPTPFRIVGSCSSSGGRCWLCAAVYASPQTMSSVPRATQTWYKPSGVSSTQHQTVALPSTCSAPESSKGTNHGLHTKDHTVTATR